MSSKTIEPHQSKTRQQKWNHDGYYFGVYFPEKAVEISKQASFVSAPFITSSVIILLIITVLGYAVTVILKQKRLSEVKTDFINNMTHELKTPISTIALSSEFLTKISSESDFEKAKHYAQIIKAENKRLENQVERVLQLAKLDREQLELKRSQVNVNKLIKDVTESFQLTIEQRKGKLSLNLTETPVEAYIDRVHFTNVIYNLLDNANKYSPEDPCISIGLQRRDNNVNITVSDKGKGMTPTQQKLVFDKFYRADMSDIHDVKGFGLGLFYVKTIVEAHGGKVNVKSALNEGSTFNISLPLT